MENSKQDQGDAQEATDSAAADSAAQHAGADAEQQSADMSATTETAASLQAGAETPQAERKTFLDFLRSITLLRRKRNQARQQHSEMPSHFAQLDSVVEPKREDKPDDDEPIRSAN